MAEKTSYLDQLQFDPKLKKGFVANYLSNPRLVVLLVIMILITGITSFLSLPKVLNPDIKIPIVLINTVLPGAGPKDVETLVTVPIEDAVTSVEKVKTVTSSSTDSVSSVSVEFDSGVDPEKAKSDIQSAIDTVTDLPKDAKTPSVQKLDFQNTPVWTFILTSKGDQASLMRYAQILKNKLKDISTIDKVNTSGFEEQEVQIIIKPQAVSTYGVSPFALSSSIQTALNSFPAGSINTSNSSLALTVDAAAVSVEDLRNLKVNLSSGSQSAPASVLLSDIAEITERSKPDQFTSYFATNKIKPTRGVSFSLFKTSGSNIDKAVADAQKVIEQEKKKYQNQFQIETLINTSDQVNIQFNDLIRDLSITVSLIFVVLFIFLGLRQAIVASLSVPLTFLVTFLVMNLTHIALSFIAFFSLLLALGLLVDDTIVVISAMTQYYRSGKFTPLETGLLVWRDFFVAILTTTITTVWAFLPLLLSSGIIGEFIKAIPIVVSSSLIASIGVALLITLPFVIIIFQGKFPFRVVVLFRVLGFILLLVLFNALVPKTPLFIIELILFVLLILVVWRIRGALMNSFKSHLSPKTSAVTGRTFHHVVEDGVISFGVIDRAYKRLIDRILASKSGRRNTIIMVIIFSLFSYLLVPLGFVINEFFPKSDQDYTYMTLELPAGTNSQITENEGKKILESLRKTPDVAYVTADIGQGVSSGFGGGGSGSNQVLFTLVLPDKQHRKRGSIEISDELRKKYNNYNKGKLQVVEESGGPPAGADLQIKLFGDDLATLDTYANKLQVYLAKQKGVTNIDKSIKPGTSKIVFEPDTNRLVQSGISVDQIGGWLRIFGSGLTVKNTTLNDNVDKQDITIRLSPNTQTPEAIGAINIPSQDGPIPLSSLGRLRLETNPTLITREGGKRTISVSAAVTKGYAVSLLNKDLEHYADTGLALPTGYSWQTGGVNDENQKSVQSILQAMLLSFLLIIITMVVQFGSFRKALIVMLVIPLSISGVFIVFALTHTPLSFPALIGILALFGIVVKNSILIVDKIKQNEEAGIDFQHAISDAAASRLEAIALTSMTAIIGLVPITLSDPLWRGLGGAIIAGLTFSGTIMLFFIPVVYYYWFQNSAEAKKEVSSKKHI